MLNCSQQTLLRILGVPSKNITGKMRLTVFFHWYQIYIHLYISKYLNMYVNKSCNYCELQLYIYLKRVIIEIFVYSSP